MKNLSYEDYEEFKREEELRPYFKVLIVCLLVFVFIAGFAIGLQKGKEDAVNSYLEKQNKINRTIKK